MSALTSGALSAICFQLLDALERYERDAARLVATWLDLELYHTVSDEIDEILRYSASQPRLSVPAAALLIAHSELVYSLWRGTDSTQVQQDHAAYIASLRQACRRRTASQLPA